MVLEAINPVTVGVSVKYEYDRTLARVLRDVLAHEESLGVDTGYF